MSKIIVENATVERVFASKTGWGVAVYESYTPKDGQERRTRFTLWFSGERPAVESGQRVSASGFFSARVRSYEVDGEARHAVDINVNSARLLATPEDPEAAPATFEHAWHEPTERF